jgi:hypothetical protein
MSIDVEALAECIAEHLQTVMFPTGHCIPECAPSILARLVPAEDEGRLREAERVRRAIYSVWPGLSQTDAQRLVDALAATPEPRR